MFTGLIREIGTLKRVARTGGVTRVEVRAPRTAAGARAGDSVAVDGICLTDHNHRWSADEVEALRRKHDYLVLRGNEVEGADRRVLYLESLEGYLRNGWAPLFAVVRGSLKYIDSPRPELYDLDHDPNESDDLAGRRPAAAGELAERLAEMTDAERAAYADRLEAALRRRP